MLKSLKKVLVVRKPQALWFTQLHALRLQVFIECGLIKELVLIVKGEVESTTKLALELLCPILQFAAKYLPDAAISKFYALPNLFQYASDFKNEYSRHTMQQYLETVFEATKVEKSTDVDAPSSETKIKCSRQRFFSATEENRLLDLLQLSEVLNANKDHRSWNWQAIDELIECLGASKKYDELWKGSKFVARLLLFLKPSSRQYSEIPIEGSSEILETTMKLIQVLVEPGTGFKILVESKLINEVIERIGRISNFVQIF